MGTIDLNLLPMFVAVAETSSFSRAAKKLALPKSSVSRGIAALEAVTGARLFHRTTRHVALTAAGQRLHDEISPLLGSLRASIGAMPADDEAPSGTIRVTATIDFGAAVLAEIVTRFVARHPAVTIELRLTNEVIDLVAEGIDLAFRTSMKKLADSSLIARRAMPLHIQLYASASYLARRGAPRSPADLDAHELVVFRTLSKNLRFESGSEVVKVPAVHGRLISDDVSFTRAACLRGAGIALLPTFLGEDDVAAGRLARVLPRWKMRTSDLWLVMPSAARMPRALVAFRAFVLEALQA